MSPGTHIAISGDHRSTFCGDSLPLKTGQHYPDHIFGADAETAETRVDDGTSTAITSWVSPVGKAFTDRDLSTYVPMHLRKKTTVGSPLVSEE